MVNTVGKKVSEVTKSYTAGFLDADGAIMAPVEHHKDMRLKFRVRVVVRVTQRDQLVLDSLKQEFGIGKVVLNGAAHDWLIIDQAHVKWFLQILSPYIRVKENQALLALKILSMPR